MDPLMISAASGMRAKMESLDMLANNLANAGTAGYKTDREFYTLYTSAEALDPALAGESPMPATLPVVERHWTDFAQGTLTTTGNTTDVALASKGFFVVSGPSGPLYTRNGSFHISPAGTLVTQDGYPVRDTTGQPIRTQGTDPLTISPDGTLKQGAIPLGQLAVVAIDSPDSVQKAGNNYFAPTDPANVPKQAAGVDIQQGKLEASNVGASENAVRLVSLMRQFEMLQKAAQIGGDMAKRAIEEVARV